MTWRQSMWAIRVGLAASIGMMIFGFGAGPAAQFGLGGVFLLIAFICALVAAGLLHLLDRHA